MALADGSPQPSLSGFVAVVRISGVHQWLRAVCVCVLPSDPMTRRHLRARKSRPQLWTPPSMVGRGRRCGCQLRCCGSPGGSDFVLERS